MPLKSLEAFFANEKIRRREVNLEPNEGLNMSG